MPMLLLCRLGYFSIAGCLWLLFLFVRYRHRRQRMAAMVAVLAPAVLIMMSLHIVGFFQRDQVEAMATAVLYFIQVERDEGRRLRTSWFVAQLPYPTTNARTEIGGELCLHVGACHGPVLQKGTPRGVVQQQQQHSGRLVCLTVCVPQIVSTAQPVSVRGRVAMCLGLLAICIAKQLVFLFVGTPNYTLVNPNWIRYGRAEVRCV